MAVLNMFQASVLRIEDEKPCWGQLGCSTCSGKGWILHEDEDEHSVSCWLEGCTNCCEVHSPEDQDRLNERLFLVTYFHEYLYREHLARDDDGADLEFN